MYVVAVLLYLVGVRIRMFLYALAYTSFDDFTFIHIYFRKCCEKVQKRSPCISETT